MPVKTKPVPSQKKAKATGARMSLTEVMSLLKKSGTEQTRKTFLRHGAEEPMFGVLFAVLKTIYKKIKVDHDLALKLWDTGNFDARNLAVKIVDPALMTPAILDQWAKSKTARMCHSYVAHVAVEGPHARSRADAWLASPDEPLRCMGWMLVSAMAMKDEATPDAWFTARLAEIEKTIQAAPNDRRESMNHALIAIGCRNASFRKVATAAAKRIGPVEVDHGDTCCETPDAKESIDKTWARSTPKFENPAAAERARESMRTRC